MIPGLSLLWPRLGIGVLVIALLGVQQLRVSLQRAETARALQRYEEQVTETTKLRLALAQAEASNRSLQHAIASQNAQLAALAAQRDAQEALAARAAADALARVKERRVARPPGSGAAYVNGRLAELLP